RLQECDLPYPDFARSDGKLIESGKIGILEKYEKFPLPFVFPLAKYMLKFDENELQTDAVDDISAIEYYRNDEIKDDENHYRTFEFDYSMTGFISFKAQVYGDSEIFLVFDETLNEEHFRFSDEIYEKYYHDGALPVYWHRLNTVNIVKYKLCAGAYDLMTIEPYCLKFLRVIVKGKADISGVHIRRYENSDAFIKKADFPDKDLNELYVAAQRTFAQCSVDYLMDCPSRERAAWLCDSYFSAKAERLFTGNNRIEKNTLSAFLLMPEDNSIPKYMIPMCYHINPLQKEYMPTWAGWFVIELHDYLLRTGYKEFTDKFKEKVCGLIDGYFGKYLNEYGLLENLGGFVFIEWSKANDFTKGVSFCANMVFYRALLAAYGLYGDEKYKAQAEKVKDAVIKLSYNGEFFVDNALRENGKLQRTENVSETCQYYAFHCGIADEKTFPELYGKLLSDFGKKRDDTKVYPQVHRSNAFIGDMLRLDYLAEHGRAEQALEESKNYYLNMVKRTGTLWEHDSPIGSLVHCFSALVAVWIEKFYINHNIK
ncbi:MAG: hypothetical protein IJS67_03005, partial [Clostridia bacterium]|nr:hypothetical protein [Clostridia bacterium]